MTTRLYTHELSIQHITPPGHPERPDRIKVLDEVFADEKFDALERVDAPKGDESLFELAHPAEFVKKIKGKIPEEGLAIVDADTSASPKSWETVLHVTGAAVDAVDSVFEKKADNAFISMRPPGHHAEKTTAMGFCLVNHVAIAARYAQEHHGCERVAIVDFDVHHGNGTQDIFYDDPTVLFASTHQMPLYPGSGALNETGVGNVFNAPLSPGDDGSKFKEAFRDRVLPSVENFKPDLILISAGFDAHYRDPLASLNFVADDYDWATGKLMEIAETCCESRVVSLLEGGYDLQGLAESASEHVNRLMTG
ncbi:MAG: histone deacetylase family protein [Pseudomonadota bacterium]